MQGSTYMVVSCSSTAMQGEWVVMSSKDLAVHGIFMEMYCVLAVVEVGFVMPDRDVAV